MKFLTAILTRNNLAAALLVTAGLVTCVSKFDTASDVGLCVVESVAGDLA